MAIHLGNILEQAIRMERIGISELSRKLRVSRRTIYNWFEQENLNIQIILKVGEIIGHDFSAELPENLLRSHRRLLSFDDTSAESRGEIDNNSVYFWMNKYVSLLEKYNDLLSLIADKPNPNSSTMLKRKNTLL